MSAGIISTGKYIPSIKISIIPLQKNLRLKKKVFEKLGLILDFSQIKRQFRLCTKISKTSYSEIKHSQR